MWSMSRIRSVLCAGLALLLAGCSPASGSDNALEAFRPPAKVNYDTCTVERGDYVKTATASAGFEYPVKAALTVGQTGLRITEISAALNREVKQGEVLVRFSREEGGARLTELIQGLEKIKRDYALEKARLERELRDAGQDLQRGNYYAFALSLKQLELQKLESVYDQYLFETERALRLQEKAIEKLTADTGPLELTAPFDGIVEFAAPLNAGDLAPANQALFVIASTQSFLVYADNSTAGFRYQMPVTLETGPAKERESFQGRVISVANLLPARLELKPRAYIRPDASVGQKELSMNLKATGTVVSLENVLMARRSAMRMSEGNHWVTILSDDMLQKRRILVGQSDAQCFVILDGLTEGQRLLID